MCESLFNRLKGLSMALYVLSTRGRAAPLARRLRTEYIVLTTFSRAEVILDAPCQIGNLSGGWSTQ